MEVAWKCTLHRAAEGSLPGEGSLPASCALAGSHAHRTPMIGKISGRFTNMRLTMGGPCHPLLIVTGHCQRVVTEADRGPTRASLTGISRPAARAPHQSKRLASGTAVLGFSV